MNKEQLNVKRMAQIGILGSLIVIMGYTPLGIIPIPGMAATILHIPVIIGALILGGKMGASLGLIMGLTTLSRAFIAPTGPLDLFFRNPLVSVLPRILIGITVYAIYTIIKKVIKKESVALIITSALGSIANTVFTLGMLMLVYSKQIGELAGSELGITASALMLSIITTNAVGELIVTALLVPPIVMALRKQKGH